MTQPSPLAHRLALLLLLHLLQLHLPPAHAISLQSRRVQTTFTLLTNTTTCPSTVTHTRISTFRNINPSAPSASFDGFLWDTLLLDSVPCQETLTSRLRQSTFLRARATSPPGVPPDAAAPFFLEGRDNSPRACAAFNATFPATYLFTDDVPTFRARFARDGLLDPGLARGAARGDVYMFAVPASAGADVVGRACAYVEQEDVVLATPAPEAPDMPACFPGRARVAAPRGLVQMRELRLGDEVVVPGGRDSVVSFTHAREVRAAFVELGTRNGSIVVSRDHLLVVNGRMRPGGGVVKGDYLRRVEGDVVVEYVAPVSMGGLYAPVTTSGVMIVDGFVVSCYTDVLAYQTAHALLSPVRVVSRFVLWDCCSLVDGLRNLWWGSQS